MSRGHLALMLVALAACQATAPELPRRPSALSGSMLAQITVDESVHLPIVPLDAEPVPVLGTPAESERDAAGPLTLEDVLGSVEAHFPLIQAALVETDLARARELTARGGFDTRLVTRGLWDAEGFYESERVDVGLEQPTRLWGTKVSGGYRLGTGDFASYDGKAKTDEGGEFRLGVEVPLLQGRAIDPRRIAEWTARLQVERAEPVVRQKRLEATLKAAETYWKWVAAGMRLRIARRVLGLAEERQEGIRISVQEGQLPAIAVTDNERLIVERRAKRIAAERKFQEQSILLSLFWRDAEQRPVVPGEEQLPGGFPAVRPPADLRLADDLDHAVERRPELRALELERRALQLELDGARNALLPSLDVTLYASQDVGETVNTPDDKGPFEVSAGLRLDVPLQRRSARGKAREVEAKMAKLDRELQYARDVVISEVLDAVSALERSWEADGQAAENVRLARELAAAERLQLDAGESDLLRVNLREQQSALAADTRVSVLEDYFRAWARYRAVLGIAYDEVGRAASAGADLRPR